MSADYLIRIAGVTGTQVAEPGADPGGLYVSGFDPDAHGGAGEVFTTAAQSKAYRFRNQREAVREYLRASAVRPLRSDGCPNRPMTAYAVEIMAVPGGSK